MRNLVVFIAFFVLVSFTCGQNFDRVDQQKAAVSLSGAVSDVNRITTTTSGSVLAQTLTSCLVNTHSVAVQINNGPKNSGSYFEITLAPVEDSLTYTFGVPGTTTVASELFNILRTDVGAFVGAEGTVSAGSTATFWYYCENYTSKTPLQVRIWSTGVAPLITYDLTVTQYTTNIRTIPASRTLDSTAVFSTEDAANIAGENFVHFYHDLQRNISESGQLAKFVIEATNWNTAVVTPATGPAKICVSFTNLVQYDGILPGVNQYFPGVTDLSTFTSSPLTNPCPIFCTSGDILDATSALAIVVDSCTLGCVTDEIWIGIIPPQPALSSTFKVSIRFLPDTIVPVGTIPAGNGKVQGVLNSVLPCAVNDLSCEDYYTVTQPSSTPVNKYGPYLSLELYAVNNGAATVDIYDGGLGGASACCNTLISSCSAGDDNVDPLYCWTILHPCNYKTTAKYTATVSSKVGTDPTMPIEYALNTFVGSWPSEVVTPNSFTKPTFGTVKPLHYHHYEVTFSEAQLNTLSYFQVELYSLHEEDNLEFFWKFGSPAGLPTECFSYDGKCVTNTDCTLTHDDPENTGFCRYLFLPCDIKENYADYAAIASPLIAAEFDGLKVAQLKAGTYYFAVRGQLPDVGTVNVKNEYTYTIKWNLQQEIPIFDSVSINNAVYFLDYSQQYVFDLPKSKLYTLIIKTTYVFNGVVTTYVNCDSRAGTCPCGNSVTSCSAGTDAPALPLNQYGYECEIQLDAACACKDKLYIAVKGVTAQTTGGTYTPTFDVHKPIPYILTVLVENLSESKIPTLTASRAGYYHADQIGRTPDTIEFASGYVESGDGFSKFYKISFANAEDLRNDMFLVDLTVIDGLAAGLHDLYDQVIYYTGPAPYSGYLRSPDAVMVLQTFDDCTIHGNCWAGTKADDLSSLPTIYGNFDDTSQGYCRIALQPCALSESACPNVCKSGVVSPSAPPTNPFVSPAFDRTKDYYLSVRAFPHWYSALEDLLQYDPERNLMPRVFGHLNNIYYHLKLQIVEQAVLPLAIDTPVYGNVGPKQYVHFQYDVATAPTNSKLVFEVYRNHNEEEDLFFYVNHWNGTGNATWAGESYDCYGIEGCNGKCELRFDGTQDFCSYEVAPCDLKSARGTYFLSVATRTRTAVWTDSTYGVKNIDFTISAKHVALVEILGTKTDGVERGTLRHGTSLYYSVTVPAPASSVLGRILTIELEDVRFGDVLVTVTKDAPADQCGCDQVDSTLIPQDTNKAVFKRYPCEVADRSTFYITVTGLPGLVPNECNPVGFVLRAFVDNIVEKPITLTQNNEIGVPPTFRYDSPLNSIFTIDQREIVALTFTTNSPAGTVMNIHIEQPAALQDVQVTLGAGGFVVPVGTPPPLIFGPAADTTSCTAAIQAGSALGMLDWFVDSCSVPNTSTKWFLLFSGEQIPAESGNIIISIRVIPPQAIVVVPPATSYGIAATTTVPVPLAEVAVLGRRVITSAALGLGAGETLTFTFTNTMNINIGTEVGAVPPGCTALCSGTTCTVEACETISPQVWYFGFENQVADDTLSITRTAKPWTALTTQTVTTLSANVVSALFDVEASGWKYFTYSVPAETNGAYIVEALAGATGATLVEVTTPIFSPQYAIGASANILLGSGAVAGTCGGAPFALPVSDECCYSAEKRTFAVLGPVTGGQLSLKTTGFAASNTNIAVTFPSTQTYTIGTQPYKVNYYQFTVPEDVGFYYKFEVTVGAATFYLSQGRSGPAVTTFDWNAVPPNYAVCYGPGSIPAQTIDAAALPNNFYEDVVPLCAAEYCDGQYVLTVVPTVATTVTFKITLSTVAKTLPYSGSGAIPVSGSVNIDSTEVYSEYLYTFKNTLDSVANWVPVTNDPALDPATYLPQRIAFQLSTLRQGSTAFNFDDALAPDFYIDDSTQAPGLCKTPGMLRDFNAAVAPYQCLPEVGVPNPAVLRCAVSYCDIPCGSPVYVRAFRQAGDISSWTFATTSAVEATNFGTYLSTGAVTVASAPVSFTYNNAQNLFRSAVYVKATFNLPVNSWVDITLDNVVLPNGGAISLDRFDISPTACFDYGSKINLCTAADAATCTILADEVDRCIQPDTDFNKFPVYYRVGWDSNSNDPFSFRLTFTPRSITPVVDTTLTTLVPGQTYTKSKFIDDGTWQFYKFNLNSKMGYSQFEFSIDSVACIGTDLEVYTSWQENGPGGFEDWVRPNRWSVSTLCSGFSDQNVLAAGLTNNIFGECHLYGGEYRVAIFAPTVVGRDDKVTYGITAKLSAVPFVTIYPGCPYTQTFTFAPVAPAVNEYIPRFELVVDAANRGSKLSIFASLSDVTAPFTLYASKNANPYPSDTTLCGDWTPVAGNGYYSTATYNADNIAEIVIPECDFETDIWYLYLVGAPALDVQVSVWATFDTQYIPVADLSGVNKTVSWSATIGAGEYQTYKVIVNPLETGFALTPKLTVPEDGCLDAGAVCDFNVVYKEGSAGFAGVHSAATVSTGCVSGTCSDALCSIVSPIDKSCTAELCPVAKEVFFTVSSVGTGSCPYVFEVTTARSTPVNITANTDICVHVESLTEQHYYSFTNVQTVTISNPDAIDITIVQLGACGVAAVPVGVCAAVDAVCTFDYCGGVWAFSFAGAVTCGFDYGISTPALTVTPITLGTAVATGVKISSYTVTGAPVIFTSAGVVQYSVGGIVAAACQTITCAGDNVLRTVDNKPTTYYFYDAAGLIVKATTSRALTTSDIAISFATETVQHFSFSLPAGISTYDIVVSDLSDSTASIEYAIATDGIPFTTCSTCSARTPTLEGTLAFATCGEGSISGGACLTARTFYVSFSSCATGCGLTFNARLVFPASSTALPTISGNHNTAYTIESDSVSCDGGFTSLTYQVNVTDILAVSLRNPNADASVDIAPLCGASVGSCAVTRPDYAQYSCQVGDICGPQAYCYAPGLYTVTVTAAPSTFARYAEFLVVNQWVDLAGSVSDSIIGAETHFYRVNNAAGSLSLSLTVSSGPAVEFYVFDGCSNLGSGFEEAQICASKCNIWLPTKAKHSSSSVYYIEIVSKGIDTVDHPNNNIVAEKTTSYTLASKIGTANCAAPPSAGFCASTSFEGVNVWANITTGTVWSFTNSTAKDQEARCKFDTLVNGCPPPSPECRQWLKIHACLDTFPQCDASGFQTGICTTVCNKIKDVCQLDLGCCSDQYVDTVEGSTCYVIPPPPPPETVEELPELDGADEIQYPPSLDTPIFSTIQVYLPPADELFENIPLLKDAVVEENSGSSLIPQILFIVKFF